MWLIETMLYFYRPREKTTLHPRLPDSARPGAVDKRCSSIFSTNTLLLVTRAFFMILPYSLDLLITVTECIRCIIIVLENWKFISSTSFSSMFYCLQNKTKQTHFLPSRNIHNRNQKSYGKWERDTVSVFISQRGLQGAVPTPTSYLTKNSKNFHTLLSAR